MNKKIESVGLQTLNPDAATTGPFIVKEGDLAVVGHVTTTVDVLVGAAEISLTELYALKKGAVVQLNEKVDDLVSLSINNKVIARGNLVVVDDNFGFEVVEILP